MEKEKLKKAEELAELLLTPQQIGDLLELNGEEVAEFSNQFCEAGKMYRRILAIKAKKLHELTLHLADIGSPAAIEQSNEFLRSAQIAIE